MRIGTHLRFALVTLSFVASALAEDAPKDYDWVDREACGILGGMQESVDRRFECRFAEVSQESAPPVVGQQAAAD